MPFLQKRKLWVIPVVASALLLLALLIIMLSKPSPKAKASNIAWQAETWKKRQASYIAEHGKTGNCSQIGYELPKKGSSQFAEFFEYDCGVLQNGIAYWSAVSNEDLGDCKAKNKWGIYMDYKNNSKVELPDEPCQKITPKFNELGIAFKKAEQQAQEPAQKQEANSGKDDAKNATAELEKEAKKWQKNIDSYKAVDGKFFSFVSKKVNSNGYSLGTAWTATSKVKIGNCPAKSSWRMSYLDGESCMGSNEVPPNCGAITPKAISEYWICVEEGG